MFLIKSFKILLRKAMWVYESMWIVQKKTILDFTSKGCLHVKTDQNNGLSQPRTGRWSWTTWGRIKLQRHHKNTLWRHTIQSVRCRQPRPGITYFKESLVLYSLGLMVLLVFWTILSTFMWNIKKKMCLMSCLNLSKIPPSSFKTKEEIRTNDSFKNNHFLSVRNQGLVTEVGIGSLLSTKRVQSCQSAKRKKLFRVSFDRYKYRLFWICLSSLAL